MLDVFKYTRRYAYCGFILALLALIVPAQAQNYTGKLKAKKADISSQVTVGTGASISTITGSGFVGNGSGLTNLTPVNISAGSLGSGVIASSLAVNSVYTNAVQNLAITDAKVNDVGANKISAGSLGAGVIASSIAVNTMYTNGIQDLAVTDAKINSVSGSKVTGNISGSASTIYGTIVSSQVLGVPQLSSTQTWTGANTFISTNNAFYGSGANLTGVNANRQYKALSGYNGTLGIGTTFFTYAPSEDVTISKIIVTIVEAGEDGISAGTVWKCGSTAANSLSVTTSTGAAPGSKFTTSGSVAITAGVYFGGWLDTTDEDITPSANVICEFK